MDQRPQHKTSYVNLKEEKVGNSLECIGTGDNFLNRTPMAQALRSTINNCDIMKLKNFCKAKNTSINIGLQNGKISPIPNMAED